MQTRLFLKVACAATLPRCINGLEVFNEGALSVDGNPLLHDDKAAMPTLRQRVGMIFQGFMHAGLIHESGPPGVIFGAPQTP